MTPRGGRPRGRVRAPYRLSPLGVHTDHQLGLTLGFTLQEAIEVDFEERADGRVIAKSENVVGTVDFSVAEIPGPVGDWGDYVRGVAKLLRDAHGATKGATLAIRGDLPSGGVSSSAALLVGSLIAFQEVNGLRLDRKEQVGLVMDAERAYAKVAVGMLDPSVILYGKSDAVVVLDCQEGVPRLHRFARSTPPREWVLVDSGHDRELRTSPYNDRVRECREAAIALGASGADPKLRDVAQETFQRARARLSPVHLRRAEHFFSEQRRVKHALTAISSGDLPSFGRLMTASADSLTQNFECGTPRTQWLVERLRDLPGVLGVNYCGAGFGGMLSVLAAPGSAASVLGSLLPDFSARFPGSEGSLRVRAVAMGPGASVLE